jgi:creatinine amidohydrolase
VRLDSQELQDLIAKQPLAWVPLGILERHGEHLPYGLDGFKAHGVCMRLAQSLGGVVLPATHLTGVHGPWNPDPEVYRRLRREVGDFYIRPETMRMLLEDTVDGLADVGFETIVLYSGHYPQLQRDIVHDVADRRTQEKVARVIAFYEPLAIPGRGDHAGQSETSLYMATGGQARLDAIKPEHVGKLGYFSASGPGPLAASREYGEEVIQAVEQWFRTQLEM